MLWLVGLGISGSGSIPDDAARIIRSAEIVYLETFTSPACDVEPIGSMAKDPRTAKRWMVEDGREILDNAAQKTVALVSYGDPLVATTHNDLRVRAAERGIPTGVVHASSAITSAIGECGLHHYKVGRMATVMNDANSLTTPYYVTYRNAVAGGHTVLLLEYNEDGGFFLDPAAALRMLLDAEAGQRRGVFTGETYVVVASRVGLDGQRIRAGRISSMVARDFGPPPHTLVVPGQLHFTERDAIMGVAECLDEPPPEAQTLKSIPSQMIEKYVPMVEDSIRDLPDLPAYRTVLENARLYVQDAIRALEDGQVEVAVLSIGYADGLVDALRLIHGIEPKM